MPRLPDIPLNSWLQDQQERFREQTDGLFPALEFELGARDASAQIPPDFDAVGGYDQWQEAERLNLEEEYRRQQQEAEQRRQEEIQAQAEQYRMQQEQAAAEQQAQQQEQERSTMDLIRGLGIPTPGDAFKDFQMPGNASSTTGALDSASPPSEVDQFNNFAGPHPRSQPDAGRFGAGPHAGRRPQPSDRWSAPRTPTD